MFKSLRSEESKELSDAINRASRTLITCDVGSQEYSDTLSHLERLYSMKIENRKNRITPDTMVIVGGNLLGILVIVAYEQKNIIGSKALSFLQKFR